MSTISKSITIFVLLLLSGINIGFSQTNEPDFAFPKKVTQEAEANLNKALKNGNGKLVIESLIEYAVAQDKINSDSIQSTLNKIERVASVEKDPCIRALINILLSQIYSDIYTNDYYTYNCRDNVSTKTPSDITEWSKADFDLKASELHNKILADSEALKNAPLKNYKEFITHNNLTFIYFPTLYDFAVFNIITSSDFDKNTPQPRITNFESFITTPINDSDDNSKNINKLFHDVISFHRNDIAPLINWEIIRLKTFNSNNIVSVYDDNNDSTKDIIKALEYLYNKYEKSEYASYALIELWTYASNRYTPTQKKDFHSLLTERLKHFPLFDQNCEIQNILARIEQKNLTLKFDQQIVPNDTINITLTNSNNNNITIDIIRLPDELESHYSYTFKRNEQPNVYKSFELNYDSIIPFSVQNNISATISQPGYYSIVAYPKGSKPELKNLSILHCSEFSIITSSRNTENGNRIWVINPKTGKPCKDATVELYSNSSKGLNNPDFSFKSSLNGTINAKLKPHVNYKVIARKGWDYFCISNYLYTSQEDIDSTWLDYGTCLTSLPLYHPGDIVEWSAVIQSIQGENKKLAKNKKYNVSFRDANYMEIDTAIVNFPLIRP